MKNIPNKRFYIQNGEILDSGFFIGSDKEIVKILNEQHKQLAELKAKADLRAGIVSKEVNKICKQVIEENKQLRAENEKLCGGNTFYNYVKELQIDNRQKEKQLKEKDEEIETIKAFLNRTTFTKEVTKQVCEKIRKALADNEYVYSFINPKNKNKANMDGYFDCLEEIKDILDEIEETIKPYLEGE